MTRRSLNLIQHQHLYVCREAVLVWLGSMFRLAWRQREQRAHEEHVCVVLSLWTILTNLRSAKQDRARHFLKRHLSLLSWGKNTRCMAHNGRIVSDFRHFGVWNFRRIVFHASLQVESSCYRFFLCCSPGHYIDKRQRKISSPGSAIRA